MAVYTSGLGSSATLTAVKLLVLLDHGQIDSDEDAIFVAVCATLRFGRIPMFYRVLNLSRLIGAAIALTTFVALSGCSSYPNLSSQSSTVTMTTSSPANMTLQSGKSTPYSVSVAGTSDTSVSWNIVDAGGNNHKYGDATVGTITPQNSSASVTYTAPQITAPAGPETITIYAGASADTSISEMFKVTITPQPAPIGVAISPTSASAQACPSTPCPASMVSFSATVINYTQTSAVTWEVDGHANGNSQVGTITSAGVYTAPASVPNPAAVTVAAVSVEDPTKSATATVTIVSAGTVAVSISPQTAPIFTGASQQFKATVIGALDSAVTWSLSCTITPCGTISLTGTDTATYTAPAEATSVALKATSVADTSKSATASITVSSPVQPTLSISYNQSLVPLHAGGSPFLLTATVNNPPSGSNATITWGYDPTKFCISSDEEGVGSYDNCQSSTSDGDDTGQKQPDGPSEGSLSVVSATQANYTPPGVVFTGNVVENLCPQATAATPYVNIPVSADLGNGTTIYTNVCIEVLP